MKIRLKNFLTKLNYPLLLILIAPLLLSIYWFKEGNIMGFAESGLPFYSFQNAYESNKDAWAYYTLGYPLNISSAAIPTYWFLSQLQNMGIPGFVMQALFLWLVFVISGSSVYFLFKELFPDKDKTFGLLAVLFFWFNPISLVNVWNRFLNNFFFFYALLPLTIYLLIKGLETRRYIYAILIGLSSVILSYALTSIAFNLLLWGVILYFVLFYFITRPNHRLYILKFFFLTFIFWSLVNSWWLSQVFSYLNLGSFNAVTTTSFTADSNHRTFTVLSERLGNLIDIFRLKHASFFADINQHEWVKIYQFPPFVLFEFLVTSIFLLPLVKLRKNFYILMFGGLALFTIFLAKGNNPPFGEIFNKVFLHLSFLQIFRNPLEKFGFILAFSSSILFAVGCFEIHKVLSLKLKRIFLAALFCWIIFLWAFPFWSGYVFTSGEVFHDNVKADYQVKVPSFYKDASNWLRDQKDNFRLTVLPIGGEGITYSWEKSYTGVELSNQLFPKTSISFNTNIPFYDAFSNDLERIFLTKNSFPKIMDVLNSRYLVVRSDINWKARHMRNPQTVHKRMEELKSSNKFKSVKQIGDLSFWEYSDWQDRTIYSPKSIVRVNGSVKSEDILQLGDLDVLSNSPAELPQRLIKSEIVHPGYIFELGTKRTSSNFSFTEDLIFPATRLLPSNMFYPLILIKEKIELTSAKSNEELLIKRIALLGKRLIEAEKEAKENNSKGVDRALNSYIKQLEEVVPSLSQLGPPKSDKFLLQEELFRVFKKHIETLTRLKADFPKEESIAHTESQLKKSLIQAGISPVFKYIEKPDYPVKNRKIYQFTVNSNGNYELLLDAKSWNKFYKFSLDQEYLLQIDDQLIPRKATIKNDYISFGEFNFNSGKHEVGWNSLEPVNLIEAPTELIFKVDHGEETRTFPINALDPYSEYILSFNYFIKKGSGVETTIEQNNEVTGKDIVPNFSKYAGPDLYNFEHKNFTSYFIPLSGVDSAKLVFRVKAWNNCKDALKYRGNEQCQNEEVQQRFDLPTELLVSNISLVKLMTETPFLLKSSNPNFNSAIPPVNYTKINNSEYRVNIPEAQNPFILVLSELFDPGWKVLTRDGSEVTKNHFVANGYANGWIIDELHKDELIIKFTPQNLLNKGKIISLGTLILGLILLGRYFLKKNR